MSENYPSDVKLNENQDGTVSFATEVIATIAGLAANEVDGVTSMVSPASGLADMFSRKNNRNLTKGVRIDLEGSQVTVDVTIVVDYGSPVPDVARNIQENVKKAIETMSGLDVKKVDVHVTDISFEREQRANAELDEQQRKMLEKNAEAAEQTEATPEAKPEEAAPVEEEPAAETEPEVVEEEVVEAEPEAPAEPEPEPEPVVEAPAAPAAPVQPEPAPVAAAPVEEFIEEEIEQLPDSEDPESEAEHE